MSKMVFELNSAGVRELLKSQGAQNECKKYADQIYNQVSGVEGYITSPRNYKDRSGYAVTAVEYPAIADNLKNNTLAKAGKV